MRKKMTVAVLSILALFALAFAIGLFLPKQREFVKTATFKSSPEKVFQIVTDVENQLSWRSDVQEINIIDEDTWTEVPKKGTPITFKTKQEIQNQLFEIEIIEPKSFDGYWIGTFEQTTTGTKVVFKEVITIENPFFRVMSSIFVDLDQTMEVYMTNLKNKLGE
ncbi:MAG TPA: SRPBCC family protein [Draconibacterium sp.]|nr:SRPBCC family protein [Draconibacterium sp.]